MSSNGKPQLIPQRANANRHTQHGLGLLEKSIQANGIGDGITVAANNEAISGSARLEKLADIMPDVKIQVVETTGNTLLVNKRMDIATPDSELGRRLSVASNQVAAADLDFDGEMLAAWAGEDERIREMFDAGEWAEAMKGVEQVGMDAEAEMDRAEELQEKWQISVGDVWRVGVHFVACGDCRDAETWRKLLSAAGADKVNGVFTSPPYAEQRKKQYGGTPTEKYVEWWEAVQANVRANLAADGSFFVNIKPHCSDGERVLYVFDLVLAMKRQWGWRFVDELCWTNQGFPGEPQDRFQNAFEPIYHFSIDGVKFNPKSVAHESDGVPIHSKGQNFRQTNRGINFESPKVGKGMAYPRNVLSIPNGSDSDSKHAAAFPVALPTFFVKAYSDAGDVWCDPFAGSGTTIIAAQNNGRRGLGIELLEKYCAVILERFATAFPALEIARVE